MKPYNNPKQKSAFLPTSSIVKLCRRYYWASLTIFPGPDKEILDL